MTSEYFVPLHEFDESRLVVGPPVEKSFGKGKNTVTYHESEGFYKDDDGNLCKAYFEFPKQTVWGVSPMYPFAMPEKDRDPSKNLKGFQICYPMTSKASIDNPSKDEKYALSTFDGLFNVSADAMKRECSMSKSKRKVPMVTNQAYVTAKADGDYRAALKPIYSYPIIRGERGTPDKEDRSKPQRAYIKLMTYGKGVNLVCNTIIHGPGDKPVNPRSLMGKGERGEMTPVFLWEGVYWGGHGSNSPYGASVKLRLSEANYTPGAGRGPSRRMLPKNDAPIQEDDAFEDEEDMEFASPLGDEDFSEDGEIPLTDDLSNSDSEVSMEETPKPKKKKKVARRKRLNKE